MGTIILEADGDPEEWAKQVKKLLEAKKKLKEIGADVEIRKSNS